MVVTPSEICLKEKHSLIYEICLSVQLNLIKETHLLCSTVFYAEVRRIPHLCFVFYLKEKIGRAVVVHTFKPRTRNAEAGGFL